MVSPDTAWLSTAAAGVAAVEAGDAEGGDRALASHWVKVWADCMLMAVLALIAILSLQLRLLKVPLLLGGKAEETAVSRDRGLPFLSS